jgi:hypothetical protein
MEKWSLPQLVYFLMKIGRRLITRARDFHHSKAATGGAVMH